MRLGFVWCRGTERIFQVLPIAAAALVIAPNTFVTAEEFISLDQMLSKDQHCWAWLSTPFVQFFCKIVILRPALAAREASAHYFVARAPQGRQYWAVAAS